MPDFNCDVAVISAFTPCSALHTNEIYKICILICFHKPDVIKLTLFSTKNLLEVTSVTLV